MFFCSYILINKVILLYFWGEQGMTVKLYEPNSTLDARMRNLFFKSIETSARQASVKNLQIPKFYLIGECLGFYQPKLFTPVLALASKDDSAVESAFNAVQHKADNLYVSDETLDHGVTDSPHRKPLAQRNLQKPEWEPAEQDGINKLKDFMDYLVENTPNEKAAYEIARRIENGYYPIRRKEERKQKKSKKKSKK